MSKRTPRLRPLRDQVLVVTGASSGIGLVTVRMAAKRGAKVVAVARNEQALRRVVEGIRSQGGAAIYAVADVSDESAVRRVADEAEARFGRIDTWVNGAGVSVYGRAIDVSLEDQQRVMEVNFWGIVHGSRIAVERLRPGGGTLVNMGSGLSDRSVPLQAIYSASKHAVRAYTDALRMEIEHDGLPINVSLIKPGSIDTPFVRHAKNYLPNRPKLPPPVYAPDVVASIILYCAEHPVRDVFVGGGGKLLSLSERTPALTDWMMERLFFDLQQTDRPAGDRTHHALCRTQSDMSERGDETRHVWESSLYTSASLHPLAKGMVAAGIGLLLSAVWGTQSNRTARRHHSAKGRRAEGRRPPEEPSATTYTRSTR